MTQSLRFEKVLALPEVKTPNTLYFVLNGMGFDIHLTTMDGVEEVTAYPLNHPESVDLKMVNTIARLYGS